MWMNQDLTEDSLAKGTETPEQDSAQSRVNLL